MPLTAGRTWRVPGCTVGHRPTHANDGPVSAYLVLPDGRLGVVDFGLVARLPDGLPSAMGRLIRLAIADDADAMAVRIGGGEVAQDAAADLVAFGIEGDSLAHGERGILVDGDIADEAGDALIGPGGRNECDQQREDEGECAGHAAYFLKSTLGTSRAAASQISKNSAFSNLN